ncbi:31519_t:CDS:2, partial [Racocetra persica]
IRYSPIPIEYPLTSLEGCKVNKSVRICTGAKVCEFVSCELKETQHTEVDESIDFYKLNQPTDLQTLKEAKIHAIEKKSDNDILSYFIGCSAWSPGQKHFHYKLNCDEINITILEKLFRGKPITLFNKVAENCCTVLFTRIRKKEYSFFHLSNEGIKQKGKIIKLNCNVQFIKLVPLDITTILFVVLICKGIHTHSLPPPTNIPVGI